MTCNRCEEFAHEAGAYEKQLTETEEHCLNCEKLLKETQEVLKLVEWGSDCIDYENSCPVCRSNSPNNHCYTGDGTHAETCQLSNLINKINSLLGE